MTKKIEWVECSECDGATEDCKCCRGGGLVPIINYTPVMVADIDPWEDND